MNSATVTSYRFTAWPRRLIWSAKEAKKTCPTTLSPRPHRRKSSSWKYGCPPAKTCVWTPAWPTPSACSKNSCKLRRTSTWPTSAGSSLGSSSQTRPACKTPRSRRTLSSRSSWTSSPHRTSRMDYKGMKDQTTAAERTSNHKNESRPSSNLILLFWRSFTACVKPNIWRNK